MASYNKVILMGNLTRDPELKYLPSGTAVANAGLAVNRTYTDRQSGEKKEEVCFVDLETFGRTAEIINEYFQKGRPILVEGRLRLQTWETDDGQRRSKHSVMVDRFEFVGGRQDGDGGGAYDQASPGAVPASPELSGEQGPSTTDDDIPF
jgi:single-strand DNA-binding protein